MALSVSLNGYNEINLCENANDWTGSTPSDVADFFKEGSQCIGFEFIDSGSNDSEISVTENLSGITHLRMWFMCTALKELDTDANGGIQVYLGDGSNTGYWNVSGSTTYLGGWYNLVVDLSAAVTSGTKPTMAAITTLGVRVNLTTSSKKAQNTWIDHIYSGDGLIVYGDNGAGGAIVFDDILSEDENTTNGWGIIRKIGGIFYLNGSVVFGDSASVNACEFEDLSQVVVFENRPVNASLYTFTVVDNGTGLTEFALGEKVGTAGIKGCTIRVESPSQTPKFTIDGSDADVDNFKLYGCTFYGAGVTSFPGAATDVELLGCTFELCAHVDPDDASVRACFFINTSDTDAALLWNESVDIANCSFIGNVTGAAIEHPVFTSSPYTYTDLLFSGNTDDVLNVANAATITAGSFVVTEGYKILTVGTTDFTLIGAADNNIGTQFIATGVGAGTGTATDVLAISKTGTSNPSTSEDPGTNASTYFIGSVPVEVTVLNDATGLAIGTTARVRVMLDSDKSAILNAACNASGVASTSYSGSTPVDIVGWAREFNISAPDFVGQDFSGEISPSSGFSLTVRLKPI